jgi:hypothetical protein
VNVTRVLLVSFAIALGRLPASRRQRAAVQTARVLQIRGAVRVRAGKARHVRAARRLHAGKLLRLSIATLSAGEALLTGADCAAIFLNCAAC